MEQFYERICLVISIQMGDIEPNDVILKIYRTKVIIISSVVHVNVTNSYITDNHIIKTFRLVRP